MNENIFWMFETEVTGNIEEVKSLMNEMIDYTKTNDTGTTFYEWFVSDDNKKCTLFERFDNSVSALAHAGSFGKNYAMRFMEILKPKKFTVYGNPDEALKKALDKMGSLYMIPIGGFNR
ncbi:MAG TPA: hypothetical protein PKD83_03125 [Ignavibacteria bacterium]|nr:hypothetical protein [Ignavibacteria bacterium]